VEFNFKRNYLLINHAPETAFAVRVMQNRQVDHVDAASSTWAQRLCVHAAAAQTGLLCLSWAMVTAVIRTLATAGPTTCTTQLRLQRRLAADWRHVLD
jgi:hypothetical protein